MKEHFIPINLIFSDGDLKTPVKIIFFRLRRITSKELKEYYGITKIDYGSTGDWSISYDKTNNQRTNICSTFLSETDMATLVTSRYVIEFDGDISSLDKKIGNLLLSFKLFKAQSFFAPVIIDKDGRSLTFNKFQLTCKSSKPYELKKGELRDIRSIYGLINDKSDERINKVLERYNYSLDGELASENSFIELVSVLESLYLSNNNNQELTFRFSTIVSYIFSKIERIENSHAWFKQIYNVRSGLVHTGEHKCFNVKLFNLLKDRTSKLIIWYLKNKDKDKHKNIEEEIFKEIWDRLRIS